MKKLMMVAVMAVSSMCFAAAEYQVYDFQMVVKTTKGKGKITTSCGDAYVWRDSGAQKIQGVIAGCGCGAIKADGTCDNAIVALWNATTRTQITNAEITAWVVQRIGKKGEKVEHMAKISCEYFDIMLAGLGTYKADKLGEKYDRVTLVSGNFAGFATAPFVTTAGNCSACTVTPDVTDQTMAVPVCIDGICEVATESATTPYFGSYSIRYNATKSVKTSKKGISNTTLGAPAYVDLGLE